jgi:hypothetical protein
MPGRDERDTIATLLVSGSAPPIPSIWRLSGEPITASRMRSRAATSSGRSDARKTVRGRATAQSRQERERCMG